MWNMKNAHFANHGTFSVLYYICHMWTLSITNSETNYKCVLLFARAKFKCVKCKGITLYIIVCNFYFSSKRTSKETDTL